MESILIWAKIKSNFTTIQMIPTTTFLQKTIINTISVVSNLILDFSNSSFRSNNIILLLQVHAMKVRFLSISTILDQGLKWCWQTPRPWFSSMITTILKQRAKEEQELMASITAVPWTSWKIAKVVSRLLQNAKSQLSRSVYQIRGMLRMVRIRWARSMRRIAPMLALRLHL